MTAPSPDLEHYLTMLEAKAAAREVHDLRRALMGLKMVGAENAVGLIEKLISADAEVRKEALETARYLRRRTARSQS